MHPSHATDVQKGRIGVAPLLTMALDGGWEVKATLRPLCPRERNAVPIVQDGEWAPGPVWTGTEKLTPPYRDSIPGPSSP